MKQDQMQQAQCLYSQTDLSNAEIADILNISRRTLYYWIEENGWAHLKKSAQHMPIMLAENCYFIMAKLQESILSEARADKPVTPQEINAMYKLSVTIGKLRNRNTLNENIEMNTHFMEYVNQSNPMLVDIIKPVVDGYLISLTKADPKNARHTKFNTGDMAADPSSGRAAASPAPLEVNPDASSGSCKSRQHRGAGERSLEDMIAWAQNPTASETTGSTTATGATQDSSTSPVADDGSSPQFFSAADEFLKKYHNEVIAPAIPNIKDNNKTHNIPNQQHLNRAQRRKLARAQAAA